MCVREIEQGMGESERVRGTEIGGMGVCVTDIESGEIRVFVSMKERE